MNGAWRSGTRTGSLRTGFALGTLATSFGFVQSLGCFSDPTCQELANCAESPSQSADAGEASSDAIDGIPGNGFALVLEQTSYGLVHGRTERITFNVNRKGYEGPITISASHLPTGITANASAVAEHETSGAIDLVVDKGLKPGPVAGVLIEGVSPGGQWRASVPLVASVRGAPGELDSSFGSEGVVPWLYQDLQAAIGANGRIFVSNGHIVQALAGDGTVDASFGTDGSVSLKSGGSIVRVGATETGIFVAHNGGGAASVDKLRLDGQYDTSYGGGTGVFSISTTIQTSALAPDGRSITGATGAPGNFFWASANGTNDPNVPGGTSTFGSTGARALVYVADGAVLVDGEGWISKLQRVGGGAAESFGSSGRRQIDAGLLLDDVVQDVGGNLVVTGLQRSSNKLRLLRLKSNGSDDPSLPSVTSSFVVSTNSDGPAARLALQSDGKILQASQIDAAGSTHCVIARYTADGKSDSTFGDKGKVIVARPYCVSRRILVQPDGRILLAGKDLVRLWD